MYKSNVEYPLNIKGRDFVIGDLHGCYDLFQSKLKEIEFNPEIDRMFSVGDLIDRGKQNLECLRLIKLPWFHSVIGNHEDMMLDVILGDDNPSLWINNGGVWFMSLNLEDKMEVYTLCEKLIQLPLSITIETRTGDIGICHAQPISKDWEDVKDISELDICKILWDRIWIASDPETNIVKNVYKTYHGHTYSKEPVEVGNCNFIDTGAVFGEELTCLKIN